jgi:hypothetical protein
VLVIGSSALGDCFRMYQFVGTSVMNSHSKIHEGYTMRLRPVSPVVTESSPSDVAPTSKSQLKISIDIYRSSSDRSKYLSIPSGINLAEMNFPADTDNDLFSVSLYKENVTIERGKMAIGLDVESILNQIEKSGYAIHGLQFSASMSVGVTAGR